MEGRFPVVRFSISVPGSCWRKARRMSSQLCWEPKCGQLLLIAPPPMKRGAWVTEESLITESVKLAEAYQSMSQKLGIAFVNAGQWNVELTFDGVHFTDAGHRAFAEGLYAYLTE